MSIEPPDDTDGAGATPSGGNDAAPQVQRTCFECGSRPAWRRRGFCVTCGLEYLRAIRRRRAADLRLPPLDGGA